MASAPTAGGPFRADPEENFLWVTISFGSEKDTFKLSAKLWVVVSMQRGQRKTPGGNNQGENAGSTGGARVKKGGEKQDAGDPRKPLAGQ